MTDVRLAHMRTDEHEGAAAMVEGHGHTPDALGTLVEPVIGPGPYVVDEVFMHYTPRVKWCERLDGFGCDNNGEWHGHWSEALRNPHHPDAGAWSAVFLRHDDGEADLARDEPSEDEQAVRTFGMVALAKAVADVVNAVVADHPMWIGDDEQPLDYLPKREALISDFVRECEEAIDYYLQGEPQ